MHPSPRVAARCEHTGVVVILSFVSAFKKKVFCLHLCHVYVPAFLCLHVACPCLSMTLCVCVFVHMQIWHHLSVTFAVIPSWPHSSTHRHVNGHRKRQSCHRGAGGAPGPGSCQSHRASARTHPQPEPHPDSPSDARDPAVAAGSSGCGSHAEESQSQPLQRRLTHSAAEVRLPPHTQPLSHDQGREGSAWPPREAAEAHRAALPQDSSAGKVQGVFFSVICCVWGSGWFK